MTAPVWALQPQDGDYSRGFAAFAQLAQERPGWEARVLPGAMHVMHTHREELLEHLREMLATMREPAPASLRSNRITSECPDKLLTRSWSRCRLEPTLDDAHRTPS